VVVFDPRIIHEIKASHFHGKSTNMPYEGRMVAGRVESTILAGKITYKRKKKVYEN